MDRTYWHKQTPSKPLFPDLLWSRPENRHFAGKLLIAGGNAQNFVAPATAYSSVLEAGVGTARVLLPDSLQKSIGKLFPDASYAPSTPSGSFSQLALAELLDHALWADGVLLPGDLGKNSETAILLEYFAEKYTGQLTFTRDAADYVITVPGSLLARPHTLVVISFAQLQKLGKGSRFPRPFTSSMGLLTLIDSLHEFTNRYETMIMTRYIDTIIVATKGQISTTAIPPEPRVWRLRTAAAASVWWLQNPQKAFEALSTSLLQDP